MLTCAPGAEARAGTCGGAFRVVVRGEGESDGGRDLQRHVSFPPRGPASKNLSFGSLSVLEKNVSLAQDLVGRQHRFI